MQALCRLPGKARPRACPTPPASSAQSLAAAAQQRVRPLHLHLPQGKPARWPRLAQLRLRTLVQALLVQTLLVQARAPVMPTPPLEPEQAPQAAGPPKAAHLQLSAAVGRLRPAALSRLLHRALASPQTVEVP